MGVRSEGEGERGVRVRGKGRSEGGSEGKVRVRDESEE